MEGRKETLRELHIFDCDNVLLDESGEIYQPAKMALRQLSRREGVCMVVVSYNSAAEGLLRSADVRDYFDAIHKDNYLTKGEIVHRILLKENIAPCSINDPLCAGTSVIGRVAFYDDLHENILSVSTTCPDVVCVPIPAGGLRPDLLVDFVTSTA